MTADRNTVLLFKTEKALEELADRRHGLRPKARQVLVLLDGKRSLAAIAKLIAASDLHPLIDELRESGFIRDDQPESPPPAMPQITSAPAPPQEEALDLVRLTRAKAYLIEISQQHLGLLAAKLQQEIATADNATSLRAALAHWNMALRESRSGASIATPCLQKVREILGHTG